MSQDNTSVFEGMLTLTEATKALTAASGKRPATSTLWRWCRRGVRGIKLEYVRLGRRILTTPEALERFAKALADLDKQYQDGAAPPRDGRDRGRSGNRAASRAHEEFSREGL